VSTYLKLIFHAIGEGATERPKLVEKKWKNMFMNFGGIFMSDIYDQRIELFAIKDPNDMPADTRG